jgi:WD40 repeat protein
MAAASSYSCDHLLATGSRQSVHLWDTTTFERVGVLENGHRSDISHLAFSPENTRIASSAYDATITVWDVASQRQLTRLQRDTNVMGLCFCGIGQKLVFVDRKMSGIHVWDVDSGNIFTLDPNNELSAAAHFASSAQRFISAVHLATNVEVIDLWEQDELGELKHSGCLNRRDLLGGSLSSMDFCPGNNGEVALYLSNGSLSVWDCDSRYVKFELCNLSSVRGCMGGSVRYGPDGSVLYFAEPDGLIQTWHLASKSLISTFNNPQLILNIAVCPQESNKSILAILSGNEWCDECSVFDLESGELLKTIEDQCRAMACSRITTSVILL